MKSRWLIRIFFMALLALCIAAWVLGINHEQAIYYKHMTESVGTGIIDGTWIFGWVKGGGGREGLNFENSRVSGPAEISGMPGMHSFFGVLFGTGSGGSDSMVMVGIPFWFLAITLAGLLFYVWRRTGKAKPAGAFPVEIDKLTP